MSQIENTQIENTTDRDPMIHLLGTMGSSGPGDYVEELEAAGQAQIVASQQLPAQADWPAFAAVGFERGDVVEGDPLFVHATLPAGWTRKPGTDSRMSHLLDERGVPRADVFYKAAHYDRRADMHLVDPGKALATHALFVDRATPALPQQWAVLTADERESFRRGVDGYLDGVGRHPDIYTDGDRAHALLRLIAAAEVTH